MSEQNQQPTQPQQQPAQQPAVPTPPLEDRRSSRDSIQERVTRAKRTAVNALLSELGFDTVDSLKTALQTARTAQSSIEAERGKVTTLEGEKSTLQQQLAQLKTEQLTGKVDSLLEEAATKAKAQYPKDVVSHIRKDFADKLKETFNEAGEATDATRVIALVDEVRKQRPAWFVAAGAGSPSNRGGKPIDPTEEQKKLAAQQQGELMRSRF